MLGSAIGGSDLFIENILVDNEDRKTALLRSRMFAMWHFTLGGSEEEGDMFLTCGSAEWGCKKPKAAEGACLHCLQENWEKNIWCTMKSLQVSRFFLIVMDGNIYHELSRYCFYWSRLLSCLSLFSLTNKIVSLFPSWTEKKEIITTSSFSLSSDQVTQRKTSLSTEIKFHSLPVNRMQ